MLKIRLVINGNILDIEGDVSLTDVRPIVDEFFDAVDHVEPAGGTPRIDFTIGPVSEQGA